MLAPVLESDCVEVIQIQGGRGQRGVVQFVIEGVGDVDSGEQREGAVSRKARFVMPADGVDQSLGEPPGSKEQCAEIGMVGSEHLFFSVF